MPRRQHITMLMILAISAFLGITFVLSFRSKAEGTRHPDYVPSYQQPVTVEDGLLKGVATAPKLENATLKAELGNAAWKLLHTMMAKFPDKPTEDDSAALKSYIHLFARLYPCGDCARHFQKVLEKYPPQVATRSTAAAWACHVHNVVNKRLKKKEFDCSKIGDFYDCGCAEDGPVKGKGKKEGFTPLTLDDKEGLTRGG
ncbi:FAD dependent sulfhydryl oxidase-like protein Erv2 [Halenospora varia]|nr:FAD dependent sulfhydryl oxidase-like protein Erv2 [Halenospora varia]